MKPLTLKTLSAIAWAVHVLFFAIWMLAMGLSSKPYLAIALGCGAVFCALGLRIALHDRRHLKLRAEGRKRASSAEWEYENITSPAPSQKAL